MSVLEQSVIVAGLPAVKCHNYQLGTLSVSYSHFSSAFFDWCYVALVQIKISFAFHNSRRGNRTGPGLKFLTLGTAGAGDLFSQVVKFTHFKLVLCNVAILLGSDCSPRSDLQLLIYLAEWIIWVRGKEGRKVYQHSRPCILGPDGRALLVRLSSSCRGTGRDRAWNWIAVECRFPGTNKNVCRCGVYPIKWSRIMWQVA